MPSLAGRLSISTGLRQFEEWRATGRYEGLKLAKCKVNADFDNFVDVEGQTAGESLTIFQNHHFPGLRKATPKLYFEVDDDGRKPSDDALNVVRTIMSTICCNVEDTTASDVRNGFYITKLMLKRLMTNNAITDRFPQGTPMGVPRFREQFTTTPDRFGPFAESMTLLLCAAGSNPLQWDNVINALASKRRIEFNEVKNRDVII